MNYLIVCRILGVILSIFSCSMVTMFPFALWFREFDEMLYITESMLIGLVFSGALYMIGRNTKNDPLFRRESLAIVGLSWIAVAALGGLPLFLGGMTLSFTDGFFEAMSGLTTTGSTILTEIEGQARSLLFWRSFLHFVGGLGIVVFFVAILPVLGVGGKNLFKQEVPGPVPEGLTPRIKDTAIMLCKVYILLNVIEMIALKFAGLSYYDAINHALATMATGGFSPNNNSIAAYTPLVEWIIIIFMFLAGTNFSLHLKAMEGNFKAYWKSTEFRVYVGMTLTVAVFFSFMLWITNNSAVSHEGSFNFRDGMFTTLSIMTTTGFGTVDFDQWPEVSKILIICLMFFGGMAGSTAGGMKLIRFIILIKSAIHIVRQEVSPRHVETLRIDGQVLDPRVQTETFAFFFFYISVFALASIAVSALMPDQDLITSVTSVAATLNCIGPGLAGVGPTMNFADQADSVKWILSFCMALGRLELYAILVLLAPRFWFPK